MLTVPKDDLTVRPTPGEAVAFAKRLSARTPSPFAPTLPLSQGEYTILIFHEHSCTDDADQPARLRYGFATLDAEHKTQVLSAADVAHAHHPAAEAAELLQEWAKASSRVCEQLDRGQKRTAYDTEHSRSGQWSSGANNLEFDGSEPVDLGLEVCKPAEVDELFEALRNGGRMVGYYSRDTPHMRYTCKKGFDRHLYGEE